MNPHRRQTPAREREREREEVRTPASCGALTIKNRVIPRDQMSAAEGS